MNVEFKKAAIREVLHAMPLGYCGAKFGSLVWRITRDKWVAGKDSINIYQTGETIEQAVASILGSYAEQSK